MSLSSAIKHSCLPSIKKLMSKSKDIKYDHEDIAIGYTDTNMNHFRCLRIEMIEWFLCRDDFNPNYDNHYFVMMSAKYGDINLFKKLLAHKNFKFGVHASSAFAAGKTS